MGTFHHDKGELHGITVVVDTKGPKVYIGRCDTMNFMQVILHDADEHDESDGLAKAEYVKKAAAYGVWKKHDRIAIPKTEVVSVTRLGDVEV